MRGESAHGLLQALQPHQLARQVGLDDFRETGNVFVARVSSAEWKTLHPNTGIITTMELLQRAGAR